MTFTVDNMTINAPISAANATYRPLYDSRDLTIHATGTVRINGPIQLYGRSGNAESLSSTCNGRTGKSGGNVTIDTTDMYVNHYMDTSGGWGSDLVVSSYPLVKSGRTGANGGNITLNATNTLDATSDGSGFDPEGGRGGIGYGGGGNGAPGSDGTLDWAPPRVTTVNESWPPSHCSNCTQELNMYAGNPQLLYYEALTLNGRVSFQEELEHRGHDDASFVAFSGGARDWLENLLLLDRKRYGTIQLSVTPANSQCDLDLYVLPRTTEGIISSSHGPGGNETITTLPLPPGRHMIAVSYADDGPPCSTTCALRFGQ